MDSNTSIAGSEAMKTTVTGEVYYRPRIALPPGAELSVVLLDKSLDDPLANLFAGTTIPLDGKNVPVPFTFVADQSMMITGDEYEVRAVIRSIEGDIIWRTAEGHTIDLSSSSYDTGKLELKMVDTSANTSSVTLVGSAWTVEDINGGGIIDNSNVTISFTQDGKISGSGGCNFYSGNYEASDKILNVVGGVALTQKACAPALMKQDQKLLTVLQQAQSYSINNDSLTIVSKNGRTIMARRN
jgi:putative lipoprotein